MSSADENPHAAGPESDWIEVYTLDFVAGDGSYGGFAELVLVPAARQSWYFSGLIGADRQPVVVAATVAALPRAPFLELRSDGLWQDIVIETPFDHVSVGLEAFGVGLDDADEARRGDDMRGDRVPLGFELDWDTAAPPRWTDQEYSMSCRVHGEVLVGREALDLDGVGIRSHRWGPGGYRGPAANPVPDAAATETGDRAAFVVPGVVPTGGFIERVLVLGSPTAQWTHRYRPQPPDETTA